jgi:hypothetical protein
MDDNGLRDFDQFLDQHGVGTDTEAPAEAEKPARGPELTPPADATDTQPAPPATNP